MKQELFSVFDAVAKLFLPPFHAPTIESALRTFRYTVNHQENDISRYPEDYILFHIGTFDSETGLLDVLSAPHSLGVAVTFLEERDSRQVELLTPQERFKGEKKNAS